MEDDLRSDSGWTTASETDRVMFSILSNADRIDLSRLSARQAPALPTVTEESRIEDVTPSSPTGVVTDLWSMANHDSTGSTREDRPPQEASSSYRPPEETSSYRPPEDTYRPSEDTYRPPEESYRPPEDTYRPSEETYRPPEEASHRPPEESRPSESLTIGQNSSSEDDLFEKRSVLADLYELESKGVKLTQQWTMNDRLDDMVLEMRKATLRMDEKANVNMMRDGMRIVVTGIEVLNNRLGILDLDGWSSEVCRDLDKHDANFARIYRKYWKRSTSSSPEMDIAMSLVTSMGFHHMKKTMSKQMMGGGGRRPAGRRQGNFQGFTKRRAPSPPSSSDEEGGPP